MTELGQNLIDALALGSLYALIALGYTMVYGILRMVNFAHGDVFMFGGYAGCFTLIACSRGGLLQGQRGNNLYEQITIASRAVHRMVTRP